MLCKIVYINDHKNKYDHDIIKDSMLPNKITNKISDSILQARVMMKTNK